MNEGLLSDFFKLVSSDKINISSQDIQNFEIFINKTDFEDIYEALIEFLNDFTYWTVLKLDLSINIKDEGQININASNKLKRNQSDSKVYSNNSYKMLYKKNLEFNRIKNTEVKKSFRNVIKNKNIDLKISFELLTQYFYEVSAYSELINKFMQRMHTIILTHRNQMMQRQNSGNYISKSNKKLKQKLTRKIYKETLKTDDNTNKTDDECVRRFQEGTNKSEIDNLTGDDISKTNKTCLSDNEVIMKTKLNFLKVLKNVTNKLVNKLQQEGKEVTLKLESEVNPIVKDTININEGNENKDFKAYKYTFNGDEQDEQNKADDMGVKESDIALKVNEKNDKMKEDVSRKETGQTIKNKSNDIHNKKESDAINGKEKKNKENCKCHCFIY